MAALSLQPNLSANDARVLNALFDPETLPSSVAKSQDALAIDASLPPHPSISAPQLVQLETQQNNIVRRITSSSSMEAIEGAITELDCVIEDFPNYADAYINRAMLRRLQLEHNLAATQHMFSRSIADVEPIFTDLSRAIHLSLPSSSPDAAVSSYEAKVLRTSYSHRAYLYLKAAETGTKLKDMDKSELEELASKDFAGAAKYGDEVAREMSVRTNPYAKMCGAIVRNALREERKEAEKEL